MKIKTRRIKRMKISAISFLFLVFAASLYLLSSLFLRTYNVSLSRRIRANKNEIYSCSLENEQLQQDIQNLSSYDRVMNIAMGDNMALFQANITTVLTESN